MLAAKALGLDTVWVGAFVEESVRKAIQIPDNLRPVSILPIGYAGKEPRIRPRRELKDLVHEA
jgi:nitroreductase